MADFDEDLTACAGIVERGDPVRFRTVMAAPVAARARLFPLYAFNVEVSRAPWVTAEPMIAEMRLQWWRDALEEISSDGPVRRHEVVTPLAKVLTPEQARSLEALIAARRWDCHRDAFADQDALEEYLKATSGTLMHIASEILGCAHKGPFLDAGFGAGVANWLKAIPELEAQGRIPLIDGSPDGVRALAQKGLEALERARQAVVPRAAIPALWPATGLVKVLKAAIDDPSMVAQGALPEPSRLGFSVRAFFNEW